MHPDDFESLFKSNFSKLCSVANRIVRNADAAKDIVQDVFLKAWNKKIDVAEIASAEYYLRKATINASLNYLESRKNVIALTEQVGVVAVDNTDGVVFSELERQVGKAIDKLTPQCKTIFVLSRFEGLKYQEIADQMNISPKTVENQMGKALRIMRDELKPFLSTDIISTVVSVGVALVLPFLSLLLVFRLIA